MRRPLFRSPARLLSVITISLLSASAAFASAGCDFINAGGFNASRTGSDGNMITATANGMAAGDAVSFTVTVPPGFGGNNSSQWWIRVGSFYPVQNDGSEGTSTHGYTMTSSDDTVLHSVIRVQGMGGSISVTASCVAAVVPVAVPQVTDSSKAEDVQIAASPRIAETSGQVINSVIGRIIGSTFAGLSGSSVGPNGFTLSYAPSAPTSPAIDATLDLIAPTADWNVWADVQGSGWYGVNSGSDQHGRQVNFNAGMTYRLSPDLLVGAFAGMESAHYLTGSASLKAVAGTLGGYGAWQIMPGLRWDVVAGHTWSSYGAQAGAASGDFGGRRWMGATGVTGTVPVGVVTLEPSVSLQAMREDQSAWTDSRDVAHDANGFSSGSLSVGGRVIVPLTLAGNTASIHGGTYADQGFSIGTGKSGGSLSARLTGGLDLPFGTGGTVALNGQYGGLGSNVHSWSLSAAAGQSF